MKTAQLVLIGVAVCFAALIFGQTPPSTLPLATGEHRSAGPLSAGEAWLFNFAGKKYEAKITHQQAAASPQWTPAAPLPLSLAKAEETARAEVRKVGGDDSMWDVTELDLRRLRDEPEPKWFCLVGLSPREGSTNAASDSFCVPISFSGEPGQIRLQTR